MPEVPRRTCEEEVPVFEEDLTADEPELLRTWLDEELLRIWEELPERTWFEPDDERTCEEDEPLLTWLEEEPPLICDEDELLLTCPDELPLLTCVDELPDERRTEDDEELPRVWASIYSGTASIDKAASAASAKFLNRLITIKF